MIYLLLILHWSIDPVGCYVIVTRLIYLLLYCKNIYDVIIMSYILLMFKISKTSKKLDWLDSERFFCHRQLILYTYLSYCYLILMLCPTHTIYQPISH